MEDCLGWLEAKKALNKGVSGEPATSIELASRLPVDWGTSTGDSVMRPVHWIMELSISEQHVDDINTLMEELISEADREIGTMAHEWNFNDDGSVCQLYERFIEVSAGPQRHS